VLAPFLLSLVLVGCVKAPGSELKETMDTVQKERAPERLAAHGRAFASVGDFTRAEQYLVAARDAGADERQVIPILLTVYIRDHRYRDAMQSAEGFLRRHPTERNTRLLLASLEAATGYANAAEGNLEAILASDPANADAHYALAELYQNDLGRPARADEHFREYLRLNPGGPHAEEARGSLLTVIQ
jgi:Tfp pilus assembly protein PilF